MLGINLFTHDYKRNISEIQITNEWENLKARDGLFKRFFSQYFLINADWLIMLNIVVRHEI